MDTAANKKPSYQHIGVMCIDNHVSTTKKEGQRCDKVVGYEYYCRKCKKTHKVEEGALNFCPYCGKKYGLYACASILCMKMLRLEFD